MTKPGGRDPRHEPDESEAQGSSRLVDRVYVPRAPTRPTQSPPAAGGTTPPPRRQVASPEAVDNEPALRRQLSRLQRQLSELQLELSRKDEELATEIEKRLVFAAEHLELLDSNREIEGELEELRAYRARTDGLEQRLVEAVSSAEAVAHDRDRDRALYLAATGRITDLTAAADEVQQRAKVERALLEQQHADEIDRIEQHKRIALEQAEEAIAATTLRLREASEDQLAELREAHERAMAALRGDLEPKLHEARDLAADRQRLADELSALRVATAHDAAERDEAHRRELAQQAQTAASHLDTRTRLYAAEIARTEEESEARGKELETLQRTVKQRELAYEDAAAALRDTTKRLQVELAESKEIAARLEVAKANAEERVAATNATSERLVDEARALKEQLDASAKEARRNAFDRRRFAAYLEEGLALIGALPAEGETLQDVPAVTSDTTEPSPKS